VAASEATRGMIQALGGVRSDGQTVRGALCLSQARPSGSRERSKQGRLTGKPSLRWDATGLHEGETDEAGSGARIDRIHTVEGGWPRRFLANLLPRTQRG